MIGAKKVKGEGKILQVYPGGMRAAEALPNPDHKYGKNIRPLANHSSADT